MYMYFIMDLNNLVWILLRKDYWLFHYINLSFSKLKNPVPNTLAGYPAPKPPHNRKSEILQFFNFKEVDADAKNVRNYKFCLNG